jgi:hypothetical protein
MARDKVHLNYGKSQTIRISMTRWHTLVLLWEITLPAFKLTQKYNRVRGAVAK